MEQALGSKVEFRVKLCWLSVSWLLRACLLEDLLLGGLLTVQRF